MIKPPTVRVKTYIFYKDYFDEFNTVYTGSIVQFIEGKEGCFPILPCDGKVLNYSDYPELGLFIFDKTGIQTINTFKLPDIC